MWRDGVQENLKKKVEEEYDRTVRFKTVLHNGSAGDKVLNIRTLAR